MRTRWLTLATVLVPLLALAQSAPNSAPATAPTTDGATVTGTLTPVFSFPNGFSADSFHLAWGAKLLGSDLVPGFTANPGGHAASAVWYPELIDLSNGFTTTFSFRISPITGSPANPSITAFALVLQNVVPADHPDLKDCRNPWGPLCDVNAVADANMAGFGAYAYPNQWSIPHSVAIKFDADPANGQWVTQGFAPGAAAIAGTGLYLNGGPLGALLPGLDMAPAGINFYSGHTFEAKVAYDTKVLSLSITDTASGAKFATAWPVNIPQVVGGNQGYVGFTAGMGPGSASQAHIISMVFSQGYVALTQPAVTPLTSATLSQLVHNGSASLQGTTLQLTDSGPVLNESGSAWSPAQMPVASFHTSFTLHSKSREGSGGVGFCLQNIPTTTPSGNNQWISGGPNVIGNSAGYGFTGPTNHAGGQFSYLQNSVCVKFDTQGNSGLYLNGRSVAVGGSFGFSVKVALSYDGTTLAMTLNGRSATTWTVNIPAVVGGGIAWVGFTGGAYRAEQSITDWTFGP